MSNRILIDGDGVKISKPGADVLTASGDNLFFDSARVSHPVYAKVTRQIGISGWGATEALYFGKTFSYIPIYSLHFAYSDMSGVGYSSQNSILIASAMKGNYYYTTGDFINSILTGDTYENTVYIKSFTDRIEFVQSKNGGSVSLLQGYMTAVVYDLTMGLT